MDVQHCLFITVLLGPFILNSPADEAPHPARLRLYAEDTPLWFTGPPAPQYAPDVVLPPASPDDACALHDIEVFDPTALHWPAHAAATLIQRAYRASRVRA